MDIKCEHENSFSYSDSYRKGFNLKQPKLNNFLDFIEISKDQQIIIGSSNRNGRFWDGSIALYNNFDDLVKNVFNYSEIEMINSGLVDGKFFNTIPNRFVFGADDGTLRIFDITDENKLNKLLVLENEHENFITEIALTNNDEVLITSCADGAIRIWDVEEDEIQHTFQLNVEKFFKRAHEDIVSSISINHINNGIFTSCGFDNEALLWDIRLEKPAQSIYQNEFCVLTRCTWHPLKEHLIAIGSDEGNIYLVDVRRPHEILTKNNSYNGFSIYRLKFNNQGLLGVCADNSILRVLDCCKNDTSMYCVYENYVHKNFIRGLAWKDSNHLFSCGYDQKIIEHHIDTKLL